MMNNQRQGLRPLSVKLLLTFLLLFSFSCRVIDSKSDKRLPSRRRPRRQNLDPYLNEIPEESNTFQQQNNYEYDNYEYDNTNEDQNNDGPRQRESYVQEDLVGQYTKSFPSAVIVSLCSGISCSILTTLLMKMIINKVFSIVTIVLSVACGLCCLKKRDTDVTDFAKALGVFFLLIIKRARPMTFVTDFSKQV
jgi:hypothetical protein